MEVTILPSNLPGTCPLLSYALATEWEPRPSYARICAGRCRIHMHMHCQMTRVEAARRVRARRLQGNPVNNYAVMTMPLSPPPSLPPPSPPSLPPLLTEITGVPHLKGGDGDVFSFRGGNRTIYAIHSSRHLQAAPRAPLHVKCYAKQRDGYLPTETLLSYTCRGDDKCVRVCVCGGGGGGVKLRLNAT